MMFLCFVVFVICVVKGGCDMFFIVVIFLKICKFVFFSGLSFVRFYAGSEVVVVVFVLSRRFLMR